MTGPFFTTAVLLSRGPTPADAYGAAVADLPGLVAYWRLGDVAGGVLADASGNGHHGSYAGSPSLGAAGLSAPWQASDGRACNFAGTGAGAVAHGPAFSLPRGTLGFYFEVNDLTGGAGLLGKDQSGLSSPDDQMAVHVLSDGTLRCYWQRGGSGVQLDTQSGVIVAGQAYHVIVAWDEVAVWLLLDGRVVAWSRRHTTGLTGNDLPWRFGIRTFDDAPGDVALDEVVLYDRRLSWAELDVLSEYARGIAYPATPTTTTEVGSVAAIQSAIAAAGPGEHVLVAPGTYAGVTAICNNDGQKWNPVVVRPRDGPGTVTLVDADIKLRNQWFVIDGFALQSSTIAPDRTSARYWRVTRCTGTRLDQTAVVHVAGMFGRGDHNDLSDTDAQGGAARPTMGFKCEIAGGTQSDPDGFDARMSCYSLFDHNHFHDTVEEPDDDREMIQLGSNFADSAFWPYCTVYRNLWQRLNADNEVMSIKSNGHVVVDNTYEDMTHSGTSRTHSRHGGFLWIEGEWLENFQGSTIRGLRVLSKDTAVVGCHFENANCVLWAGTDTAAAFLADPASFGSGTYPAPDNTLLIGCTTGAGGAIHIGHSGGGRTTPAIGTHLYASAVPVLGTETGTIVHVGIAPIPWSAAVKLAPIEVGPAAPDPLVPPGWK